MGSISFPELLIVLLVAVFIIWPVARILRRIGYSPWLGVAAIVPLLNLALLWFIAFSRWPAAERNR